MKYIAVLHQPNVCDYTIECGTKVIELETEGDRSEALTELYSIVIYDYPSGSDEKLDSATIYEVSSFSVVDLVTLYAEGDRVMNERNRELELINKLRQYEQLQDELKDAGML